MSGALSAAFRLEGRVLPANMSRFMLVKGGFIRGRGNGRKAGRANGVNRFVGIRTVNELEEAYVCGVSHAGP